jgi:hypothetical protein
VGFENHSGLTYLQGDTKPLGIVKVGNGNNGHDGFEGGRYKNAFGTYLHGSLLPKNPHFADYLISLALEKRYGEKVKLEPLDNSIEFDEKSQSLVADKSLQALIIDNGTHKILLQGQVPSEHTIALKDLYSLFTPTDKKVTPIMFNTDNIYEIYNTTYVRAPQQKIRIKINANGKAKSVEIPKEEGDNSFLFDMKSQNFLTSSYFDLLIINDYNYLYWIDVRGLKRNNVSVHELKAYYEESNDTILPIYANQTYIINNWTHRNKDVHRIMIHLNEKGDVDSVRNLPPTKNIEKRAI